MAHAKRTAMRSLVLGLGLVGHAWKSSGAGTAASGGHMPHGSGTRIVLCRDAVCQPPHRRAVAMAPLVL